ncbi:MAG: quinate 5-dehydrogenase [Caldilineaceae bacterium]|nr:quinate 5-dehydrogenase [Caldilineaceae bacterium]
MKYAVSVSLGGSGRDQRVETNLLGHPIVLERIGADGDQARARQLFLDLDDQADAFGVGGADLGVQVADQYYPLNSIQKLVEGLRTPTVDGGVVRRVLERNMVQRLHDLLPMDIQPRRVFVCAGVARYDLAESFEQAGYEAIYGDLGFGLGVPIPMRSLKTLRIMARLLMPIMRRLPFEWLYPTGEGQDEIKPRFEKWYNWATVIADDFHYIKQHMPDVSTARSSSPTPPPSRTSSCWPTAVWPMSAPRPLGWKGAPLAPTCSRLRSPRLQARGVR